MNSYYSSSTARTADNLQAVGTVTTQPTGAGTSLCLKCERELPLSHFYLNRTTQCPDRYCKECRKRMGRRQYGRNKQEKAVETGIRLPYPVITEVEDKEVRMALILNALETIRLSMERKKARVREEEAELV